MGIFDRIGRILRAETTSARRKARSTLDDAFEGAFEGPAATSEGAASKDDAPDDPLARHYARLEVPRGSDFATVKAGYRGLMKRYHPDRHSADAEKARIANEVAAALTESYDALEAHLKGS